MEDVTDTVFRRMVISFGRPDVFFTEFTNVEAILHNAPSDPPLNLRGGRKGELLNNPALYRLLLSKTKIPQSKIMYIIRHCKNIHSILDENNKVYEFYEYSGGGHNIDSPYFETAMQRTVEFFKKNL